MFISQAYAATTNSESDLHLQTLADAPSASEAFFWNIGLVAVLVLLFYVLLIAPQQRRFKEHTSMLMGLKKGDRVVTGGGLIGTIDKIINDQEVIVDLGHNMKVTALRSTLQGRPETPVKKS